MKTDDLGWVVGSDHPALNVLSKEKVPKIQWRRGPKGGPYKIKSAQNKYLGVFKKFQNNCISHF